MTRAVSRHRKGTIKAATLLLQMLSSLHRTKGDVEMSILIAVVVSILAMVPTTLAQTFEGFDYCNICGNSSIAMTSPENIKPQGWFDKKDINCSTMQEMYATRGSVPCTSTYEFLANGYNLQSLCGCEGAGPAPNIAPCQICAEGQTFNSTANVTGEAYSCAQAAESMSHIVDASYCTDKGSVIFGVRESCCEGNATAPIYEPTPPPSGTSGTCNGVLAAGLLFLMTTIMMAY
eukprot:scaffold9548_cov108-Cylindrotheca_fusiformis.AAC.3